MQEHMLPAEHYSQGGYNNSRDWSPVNLARETAVSCLAVDLVTKERKMKWVIWLVIKKIPITAKQDNT